MKFLELKKVRDGKYLKNYELTYLNRAGKEKKYEIVSHKNIDNKEQLGQNVSGCSIAAVMDGKLLLLKEFRMAVNREIYNLCAGMKEDQESLEECVARELYEETGLQLKKIIDVLPPSFAAVSISDIKNQIVFAEVEGTFADHGSDNEQIKAAFYTKEEVAALIKTKEFSSRAQAIAYFFTKGAF